MNIFSEVKEQLTTRQVAESYGLRIRKNGVACCPFHDDRHDETENERMIQMRKEYRSSNVRFCMDDENQRRTWEYL